MSVRLRHSPPRRQAGDGWVIALVIFVVCLVVSVVLAQVIMKVVGYA